MAINKSDGDKSGARGSHPEACLSPGRTQLAPRAAGKPGSRGRRRRLGRKDRGISVKGRCQLAEEKALKEVGYAGAEEICRFLIETCSVPTLFLENARKERQGDDEDFERLPTALEVEDFFQSLVDAARIDPASNKFTCRGDALKDVTVCARAYNIITHQLPLSESTVCKFSTVLSHIGCATVNTFPGGRIVDRESEIGETSLSNRRSVIEKFAHLTDNVLAVFGVLIRWEPGSPVNSMVAPALRDWRGSWGLIDGRR